VANQDDTVSRITSAVEGKRPTNAAYDLSVEHALDAIGGIGDEEVTTNAFTGVLIANFQWASVYCKTEEVVEECGWIHYSKYGKGLGTEQQSGADFGLVIKHSEDDVRVALFQSKNGHASSSGQAFVDIRRDTKDDEGNVIPQLEAMVVYGGRIVTDNPDISFADVDRGKLDWIHHLGYFENGFVSIGLHQLSAVDVDNELKRHKSYSDVKLTGGNSVPFSSLIAAGLDPIHAPCSGWISLSQDKFEKHLPNLVRLAEFYVVDERRKGGRPLVPDTSLKSRHKVVDRRTQAPAPPPPRQRVVRTHVPGR